MNKLIKVNDVADKIFELRGRKVILDRDIAGIYGVEPRRMREQVKRNIERFPEDFMFQLNEYEVNKVVTQIASPSLSWTGGIKPYAFTRNGVNMLATVLRSKVAVQRSIFIMRAFSVLEEAVGKNKQQLLSSPQVIKQLSVHSRAIMRLFKETNINQKQIVILKGLQGELAKLIQKIIVASIK
ncbi:MAG: ORF6N domain-containing protein [bacterium]